MDPDAIIILSGGTVHRDGSPGHAPADYRSTTYDEGDAFGVLGGFARVQAAAILAKNYPLAILVPTGKSADSSPSHAAIIQYELEGMGISSERIILEEDSTNTLTQIQNTLRIAEEQGWKRIAYITNAYQIARVQAFIAQMCTIPKGVDVTYAAAESLLIAAEPDFAVLYEEIKKRASYAVRVAAEAEGVSAIKAGTYRPASPEEKHERGL